MYRQRPVTLIDSLDVGWSLPDSLALNVGLARPSFYDGRIWIDLAAHERKGTVPVSRYTTYASEIETLLRECIFATGAGRSITSNAPGAVTH